MKNKTGSILKTRNKKVTAVAICGLLTLTLGIGGAFAAVANEKSLSKVENGVRTYSTNDGQTWSEKAPDGLTETVNADGTTTAIAGNPPKDGSGGIMVKSEKGGKTLYSTDGGKTWSASAPAGVTTTVGEDGSSLTVKSK